MEEWVDLDDFPRYRVSTFGNVANNKTGRLLSRNTTQRGIPTVALRYDHRLYCRSVPVLVINAFLGPSEWDHFDTPIHVDGDRQNCHLDNLMWRPRWFAIKYHQRAKTHEFPSWHLGPIEVRQTGEVFESPRDCALKLGLIEMDVFLGLVNEKPVFPGHLDICLVE